MPQPRITILYHFYYPDDVISARHFTQFAQGLSRDNWQVTVLTSNRWCRSNDKRITRKRETHDNVTIHRSYRPPLDQARNIPRMINAFWLFGSWLFTIWRRPADDVYVVGTDPQFSALIFPFLRLIRPRAKLVHWCFDLYPDAILADTAHGFTARIAKALEPVMRFSYRPVDLMVDIGSCMRTRLKKYAPHKKYETCIPWALVEPDVSPQTDSAEKKRLYGDFDLVLLYSGNMGKAHEFALFVRLARILRPRTDRILIAFGCRGNRFDELAASITTGDTNIRLLSFCDESDLELRLTAADIHLISLRASWEGVVVPSKFFGSLAVGRPVFFDGPASSSPGQLIATHDLGMVLDEHTLVQSAEILVSLLHNNQKLKVWQTNCFDLYRRQFSHAAVIAHWNTILRELIHEQDPV